MTAPGGTLSENERIVRAHFDAMSRHDLTTFDERFAPDGVEHVAGVADVRGTVALRAYWSEIFAALPDWRFDVLETVAEGDLVAIHWRVTATHTSGPYQGVAPAGARLDARGLDVAELRDGRIVRLDAYPDGVTIARQLGLFPQAGSAAEAGMTRAFNAGTRAARKAAAGSLEAVAAGVWLLRGGVPRIMNVYLIEDAGGGVTLFDAGIRGMARPLLLAAASMGGVNRVVLGHAHADHRGAAPGIGAPVLVHPADRADAEGDGGRHYWHYDRLHFRARHAFPALMRIWDGGPVEVSGAVEEGDDVSGFRAVHLPGHAPGQIGLFRERDGVALTSDCFYMLDAETGRHVAARVPHEAFNQDTELARASIRKLAELDPRIAGPGHSDPLREDVAAQLVRAAG
jgi:glyoxylase-like metal-dependent hydrolase (beta-lactamase superfamily II)/ketosteroid isomerase-like protein